MNRLNNPGSNDQKKWDAFIDLTIQLERNALKGSTVPLPFGQLPTPEIDNECDQWLEHALTSPDPSEVIRKTPDQLRPWVAARMLVANWYAMNIANEGGKFIGGTSLRTLQIFTLIGWNDNLRDVWPRFYYNKMGTLICGSADEKTGLKASPPSTQDEKESVVDTIESEEFAQDPADSQAALEQELDDSADSEDLDEDDAEEEELTWEQLYDSTEMLLSAVTHKGKYRLPIGKLPTPETDKEVDAAFETFFASSDPKIILRFPIHLKSWMGARLAVGTLTFKGAAMQGAPFTFDSYADALRAYVVTGWHGPLRELWLKFSYSKKGKLEFRYEGNEGAGFNPN